MEQQEEDVSIASESDNEAIDDATLLLIAKELTTIEEYEMTRTPINDIVRPNDCSQVTDTSQKVTASTVHESTFKSNKIQCPIPSDEIQRCYRCHEKIKFSELKLHLSERHKVQNTDFEINSFQKVPKTMIDTVLFCHLCDEKFVSVFHLEKHIMIQHNICRICGSQVYRNPYHRDDGSLVLHEDPQHMKYHESTFTKLYQCKVCYQEFTSRTFVENHYKFEHPQCLKAEIKVFDRIRETNCPYCHYSTESIQLILYHIYLHRPNKCKSCDEFYLPNAWDIFNCNSTSCTRCVPLSMIPKTINRTKYLDEMQSNLTSKLIKKYVERPTKCFTRKKDTMALKDLPCLFCDLFLADGVAVHNHVMRFHTLCPICGEEFDNIKQCKEHRKKHFYLVCVLCDCVHSSKEEMVLHYKTSHVSSSILRYSTLGSIDLVRVRENKQCPYCLDDITRNKLLDHIDINHKVIKCVKCSRWKRVNDSNCIHCDKGVCDDMEEIETIEKNVSQCKELAKDSLLISDKQNTLDVKIEKENDDDSKGKDSFITQGDIQIINSPKTINLQIEDDLSQAKNADITTVSYNSENLSHHGSSSDKHRRDIQIINSPKTNNLQIEEDLSQAKNADITTVSYNSENLSHHGSSSDKHSKKNNTANNMKSILKTKVNLCQAIDRSTTFPGKTLSLFFNIPCLFCDSILKDGIELCVHMLNVHKKCNCCFQQFASVLQVVTHYKEVNPIYKCNDCGSYQNSLIAMTGHYTTQHNKSKHFLCQKFPRSIILTLYKEKKQCPYCLNILDNEDLEVHLDMKHDVVKCVKCTNFQHANLQQLCWKCCKALNVKCKNFDDAALSIQNTSSDIQQERNCVVLTSNKLSDDCKVKKSCVEKFANDNDDLDLSELKSNIKSNENIIIKTTNDKYFEIKTNCLIDDITSYNHTDIEMKVPIVTVTKMLTDFPCLFCDLVLPDCIRIHEHITYVHRRCASCYEQFDTVKELMYHKSTKHSEASCRICSQSYKSIQSLREHFSKFHPNILHADRFYETVTSSIDYMKIGTNEQCPYCLAVLIYNSVEDHLQQHEIVRCKHCLMLRHRECEACVLKSNIQDVLPSCSVRRSQRERKIKIYSSSSENDEDLPLPSRQVKRKRTVIPARNLLRMNYESQRAEVDRNFTKTSQVDTLTTEQGNQLHSNKSEQTATDILSTVTSTSSDLMVPEQLECETNGNMENQ